MANELQGVRVAVLATDGFEQDELTRPVDGNLVTSRQPADIPAFNRECIRHFASARKARKVA